MNGQRTKKQHVVPRFYLDNFSDENGMIWTYTAGSGKAWSASPENTGVESNVYSVKEEDGEYNDELEHWLASVEDHASKVYHKLLKGSIGDDDKRILSLFFACHIILRTQGQAACRVALVCIG